MSKSELTNIPVIEWSSSRCTGYDPQTRKYHTAGTIGEAAHELSGARKVVIALSRRSSFIRTVRVPDAPRPQVQQILQIQLPNLLPPNPGGFAFDFHLTKDVTSEGRLAVVAAAQTESLRQIFSELKSANVQAVAVVPTAMGSWLLAHTLNMADCAVVEHVAEGLAIDVIAEGELRYTRVVPFPKSSDAIDAEVCRTFSIAKVPCSHVVASSGLTFEGADTTVATRPLEVFSTGQLSRLDLNIELPETIENRKTRLLQTAMRRAIILSVLSISVASYLVVERGSAASQVAATVATRNASLAKIKGLRGSIDSAIASETLMQQDLSQAFTPAQSLSDVIATVSSETSSGVWLSGITFERGKLLQIRGTATTGESVSAYVQILAADPRFRDVRLMFANNSNIDKTPVVQFSISAHILGNLPLSNPFGTKKS